jgi:hypothetical protein
LLTHQGLNKNVSVEELWIQRNEIGKLDIEYAAHKRLGEGGQNVKQETGDEDGGTGKKGKAKKKKKGGAEEKEPPKKVGPPPLRPTPGRLRVRRDLTEHCINRLIRENDTLKVMEHGNRAW